MQLLNNPVPMLLLLGALLAVAIFAGTRTEWRPSTPFRLARRRRWGQILTASWRMYLARAPLFMAIGVLFIPLGLVVALVETVLLGGFGLLGVDTTGESAGWLALLLLAVGTTLTLLGVGLVQAATACAVVEIDEDRPVGAIDAYRLAFARIRPLLGGLAIAVAVCVVLAATWFLIPVAVWLAVRWSLLAQTVELERHTGRGGLRRSAQLVRGRWLRVASLVGVSAAVALAVGPFLGAILIFVTAAPLALLNVVAGVVYALAMPFVALVTTYVYVDARARGELEPTTEPGPLPAEIRLAGR